MSLFKHDGGGGTFAQVNDLAKDHVTTVSFPKLHATHTIRYCTQKS